MAKKKKLTRKEIRGQIFLKQNGHCIFCSGVMDDPREEPEGINNLTPASCTREHVVPKVRANQMRNNIRGACNSCNNARGNMEFNMFREIRRYMAFQGWKPCTKVPYDVHVMLKKMGCMN